MKLYENFGYVKSFQKKGEFSNIRGSVHGRQPKKA